LHPHKHKQKKITKPLPSNSLQSLSQEIRKKRSFGRKRRSNGALREIPDAHSAKGITSGSEVCSDEEAVALLYKVLL